MYCGERCWRHPSSLPFQDLRDLFCMEPEELLSSTTQKQLHELHAAERSATPELAEHLELLQTLPCYAGKALPCDI